MWRQSKLEKRDRHLFETDSKRRHSSLVTSLLTLQLAEDRLVGLVVKASASRAGGPGFESRWRLGFSGSSHTSDLNIGTPAATRPGACCYRACAGTGRAGVSILWLGEVESLICSFYLSVAARKIVWADPSLRYTSLLLGRFVNDWVSQEPWIVSVNIQHFCTYCLAPQLPA